MKQLHDTSNIPAIDGSKITILQSKWYREYTGVMSKKCRVLLESAGADVTVHIVPGCLEFALAAKAILQKETMDAVVCIGVLMKGETDHYEMILQSCVIGLQEVSLEYNVPLINAILPVTTLEQVKERASDNDQNKGIEAALAAVEFIAWKRELLNTII